MVKTPEHIRSKNFKEDMIRHVDERMAFKDRNSPYKDSFNEFLKMHFSIGRERHREKNVEREALASVKEKFSSKIRSRFDDKKSKHRKLPELLNDLSLRMGYEYSSRDIHENILRYISYFNILLSIVILYVVILNHRPVDVLIIFLLSIWTLLYAVLYLIIMLALFSYMDIVMYQNVKQIEDVLPDFLQLASANISAGMTVDRALWYAVRPKFGVLATEMEDVAKATIAGENLEHALSKLGAKYESRVLKETINLIVEGISSGGEMASLLNKLSGNIKETQLMRKEIGASVTTYAIFIGVASVLAAPILFALSTELLTIIQKIFSKIHIDNTSGMSSMFSFNFSASGISIASFHNFAILVLIISSFFSAAIISIIRKGNVKDGIKTIPLFIVVSIVIYLLFVSIFGSVMGSLF